MATGIVDQLQLIEIHTAHSVRLAAAPALGHYLLQACFELGAVVQRGQCIVAGLDKQFALHAISFFDLLLQQTVAGRQLACTFDDARFERG